jgi:hypothetical protein
MEGRYDELLEKVAVLKKENDKMSSVLKRLYFTHVVESSGNTSLDRDNKFTFESTFEKTECCTRKKETVDLLNQRNLENETLIETQLQNIQSASLSLNTVGHISNQLLHSFKSGKLTRDPNHFLSMYNDYKTQNLDLFNENGFQNYNNLKCIVNLYLLFTLKRKCFTIGIDIISRCPEVLNLLKKSDLYASVINLNSYPLYVFSIEHLTITNDRQLVEAMGFKYDQCNSKKGINYQLTFKDKNYKCAIISEDYWESHIGSESEMESYAQSKLKALSDKSLIAFEYDIVKIKT